MTQWFYQSETGDWHPCSALLAAQFATSTNGPNSGPIPVRLGNGESEHNAKGN